MNLTELLRSNEGKTLEFKHNLDSPAGVLRTLVAFANTAGGKLLIGVEDGSATVCGVSDPLAQEERLANLIADAIAPRLLPDMEIVPWRQTQIIAVTVFPSPNRPHHLCREGADNGTYVRVGSTNRRADAALIGEMRRYTQGEGYDEQAMPDLDSEAIDFRAASESFASLRKLKRGDLATLRLTTLHQGRRVPSIGGLLLFGRERLQHFPDAWIQVGRFAGTDKARILDHAELTQLPRPVRRPDSRPRRSKKSACAFASPFTSHQPGRRSPIPSIKACSICWPTTSVTPPPKWRVISTARHAPPAPVCSPCASARWCARSALARVTPDAATT